MGEVVKIFRALFSCGRYQWLRQKEKQAFTLRRTTTTRGGLQYTWSNRNI
nr:unnamed protein product [Callosobruchus chinensis]